MFVPPQEPEPKMAVPGFEHFILQARNEKGQRPPSRLDKDLMKMRKKFNEITKIEAKMDAGEKVICVFLRFSLCVTFVRFFMSDMFYS